MIFCASQARHIWPCRAAKDQIVVWKGQKWSWYGPKRYYLGNLDMKKSLFPRVPACTFSQIIFCAPRKVCNCPCVDIHQCLTRETCTTAELAQTGCACRTWVRWGTWAKVKQESPRTTFAATMDPEWLKIRQRYFLLSWVHGILFGKISIHEWAGFMLIHVCNFPK